METSKKKIDILEHIIAAVAGAYYNINLTRNLVPGQMYQAVDGKEYNVNEMTGLPADAKFSEVIDYWGKRLSEKEKEAYYAFFDIPVLATVYKGNIIKNLIMDCQSYTKYRPNETTGGIFVSWRRKEELPTGA